MNNTTPLKISIPNESTDAHPEQIQPHLSITLLVYGTLKRGYWNHDRFCRNAINIRPAVTWGRLYDLPAGYPALEVPKSTILAHGTADPLADATTQESLMSLESSFNRPEGDWNIIHGELMTFNDPLSNLFPIDRLEGFRPGGLCLYHRILVPAQVNGSVIPSWLYASEMNHRGHRFLPCGRWPS